MLFIRDNIIALKTSIFFPIKVAFTNWIYRTIDSCKKFIKNQILCTPNKSLKYSYICSIILYIYYNERFIWKI